VFTQSKHVLQDFQKLKKMNAKVIQDLIEVVEHPIFNPANVQVDHNTHARLVRAVMDNMDVHDMKMEGDGEQDYRLIKRKVEAVLQELLACGLSTLCIQRVQERQRRSHPRRAR
jgi:hypothetical protein